MLIFVLSLVLGSSSCYATVFGYRGDHLAGGRTVAGPYPRNIVGVAHRTAVMGSMMKVTVLSTKKTAWLKVVDRGPWGKVDRKTGEWFNGCPWHRNCEPKRRGRYKGCLDLTPPAARKLGLSNFSRVRVKIIYQRHVRSRKRM